jgi:hypothetical protein
MPITRRVAHELQLRAVAEGENAMQGCGDLGEHRRPIAGSSERYPADVATGECCHKHGRAGAW